jgi:hypothetical protein
MARATLSCVLVVALVGEGLAVSARAESMQDGFPKQGKWEFVSRYVSNASVPFPMPLPPKREVACLSQADFQNGKLPLHTLPGCEISSAKYKGKVLGLNFSCNNPDVRQDAVQAGELVVGETVANGGARISFGKDVTGRSIDFDYKFEGLRIGDCP